MEEYANIAVMTSERPKKNTDAFKICFIIGGVLGGPALILCLVGCGATAIAFWSILQDALYSAMVFLLLGIYISFGSATSMIPVLVLTGLGIKWNKKVGAIFFSIFALITLLMFIMGILCFVALRLG